MDQRSLRLAREGLTRPHAPSRHSERLVVVDVEQQRLTFIESGMVTCIWPVSTASAGVGSESGSNQTPAGWHRIASMIGDGAPTGTVFVGRVPTGETWNGRPDERDLILTRIITLDGLEEGLNRGGERDTLSRCIYIHGTNHEGLLGSAASRGCIRMANEDLIALFDRLTGGDPVLIACGYW